MLQPAGSIIRLGLQTCWHYRSPEQLERVNALLAVMDDDPFQNQGIELTSCELESVRSGGRIGDVLRLVEGEQSSYQVLGLDRINAVMVLAPAARGFAEVTTGFAFWMLQARQQVEQLFVYKVKNLNAVTLGETLTSVLANRMKTRSTGGTCRDPGERTGKSFQSGGT